ncbi:MAG: MATE family efflux transporter [Clostridia bacterium]|nr:MATE family efflux transporter [Clostridia bacterium]
MVNGRLFKNIVLYTLPIIATSVLQLLFNTADLLVVGRYCGADSVGAVGATGSIITLIVYLFMGLSIGVSVAVAQGLGGNHNTRVHKSVHTAFPVAAVGGIVLTIVGVLFSRYFLEWMGTPEETIGLATIYMRIYFCGVLGNLVYNFGAAILRAAGDTVRPLIYLSIAGVVNVGLNLIFVIFFHMNVAGVALATAISQFVSATLVVIALMRRNDACKLELKKLCFDRQAVGRILNIGIPAGIQGTLFNISNVIIQAAVNSFGAEVVNGMSAAGNIEGYVYVSFSAFGQTALNFVGQNIGAKKEERISRIIGICFGCVTVTGLTLGVLSYVFGSQLLSLYITDSPEAIKYGVIKLLWMGVPYFLCGIMEVMSCTLRGMGSSVAAMLVSVLGVCGVRLVWIFTVFQMFHTLECLFFSYTVSWLATIITDLIVYRVIVKKRRFHLENPHVKRKIFGLK